MTPQIIPDTNPLELGFWAKYGSGAVVAAIFALVIAYLFRLLYTNMKARVDLAEAALVKEKDERAKERESFVTDRANERASFEVERKTFELDAQKMRSEFDQRMREAAQQHARDLHEIRREYQAREDATARENAESYEKMARAHGDAMDKVYAVLQKFYDRGIGPRSRSR